MWCFHVFKPSLVVQMVKRPPAVQETWVWSMGREDPLEEGTATPSNILAWKIPWTEELGRLRSMGSQRVRHYWATELSGYSKCGPWSGSISTTWELVRNAGSQLPLQASLVAQLVKNLPAMQETWVWSLGWEDPLEKGMATHSSILAWRIPWTV